MNHKRHLYLMGGMVLVGLMLFTGGGSGFGGGGLYLPILLGFCFGMMLLMMRLMMSSMAVTDTKSDLRGHEHVKNVLEGLDDDGIEKNTRRPR